MNKMTFVLISVLVMISNVTSAKELQYFDKKINFWDEPSKKGVEKTETSTVKGTEKEGNFPWKTYLDPKNKEFFREGDYTPPEPFMEVARNPTDENIKQWFELMKKKNELQTNLQVRMQEYMAKNNTVNVQPQVAVTKIPEKDSEIKIDPSRFRLRMYFESTCPHCKRMFQVLKKLQDEGFQIEGLQVDSGPVPEVEKIVPIVRADPEDLKKHGIKGVPFLLVADTKKKSLLPPIEGYHDLEEILRLLKAASRI